MKIVRIGRSSQNDIVIDDPKVSRNHIHVIQDDEGNFQVMDLGSKNGTFLNGNKVRSASIRPDDIIRIGSSAIPWRNYFPISPTPVTDKENSVSQNMDYAGFWLRFLAYFIDSMILSVVYIIVYAIIGAVEVLQLYILMPFIIPGAFLFVWLYYALMESSKSQATIGKMALSIKVTDMNGNRPSFGKTTGRFFGKIISVLILYFGFFMAGWTEKKQALHDMMADALVVKSN
jgi:uncharacterized RDD family membrane protein YckC